METLVASKDLLSKDIVMTLSLGDGIELTLEPKLVVNKVVSSELKATATLEVLSRPTFDLIQRIQQQGVSPEDRKSCLDQLSKIDDTLNIHEKEFMKFTESSLKDKLIAEVRAKKMETAKVLGLLRGIKDLNHASNEVIAQINNVAYILRAPTTGKGKGTSAAAKQAASDSKPRWDAAQLAVGQHFSCISYLHVDAIDGDKVTVKNQLGGAWFISKDLLARDCWSGDYFDKDVNCRIT